MKYKLLFFLLFWGYSASAQLFSPDSVFFLERKSLQYGDFWRKWTGDLKQPVNTGWVWRISTGYWSDMRNNTASAVPVSLEGAWKWHFVETGLRFTRTVAPIGIDQNFLSSLPATSPTAPLYSRPMISNLQIQGAWMFVGLHLPLGGVPVHVQYGRGVVTRPLTNSGTLKMYYPDGSTRWMSTAAPPPIHRRGSNMLNLGFSKGAFFAGVQYASGPGPDSTQYTNTRRMRFANVHLGLQMSTGSAAVHPDRHIRSKTTFRRFDVGISSFTNILAAQETASSVGMQAHIGWHFNTHWSAGLTYQWSNTPRGYPLDERKILSPVSSFLNLMVNPLSERKAVLLTGSTSWNRMATLYGYATGGVGWYRFTPYENSGGFPILYTSKEAALGFVLGGGFRYRWIFSQVLMHGVWEDAPYFYGEWSIGAKLSL